MHGLMLPVNFAVVQEHAANTNIHFFNLIAIFSLLSLWSYLGIDILILCAHIFLSHLHAYTVHCCSLCMGMNCRNTVGLTLPSYSANR